ncbi:Secreted protein [Pseudomonas jessenii]
MINRSVAACAKGLIGCVRRLTGYSASGTVVPAERGVRMDARQGVMTVERVSKALNERMSVYPFFEIFMWCSGSC